MKIFVRRMRKVKKNSGSTLIAVMVVTTILSLFLITLQPIMFNYAKRSVDERDLKQAEFSARSANDAIVKGIIAGDATLIAGINGIAADGSSLVLDNFTFSSSQMGAIEAKIQRISAGEFSVVTRATVNGTQRTIGREIIKETTAGVPDARALSSYYFHTVSYTTGRGFTTTGTTPVVITTTMDLNYGNLNIAGDLIVYPNPTNNQLRSSSRLDLAGNLYTGNGYFTISQSAQAFIKGTGYNNSNSQLSGSLTPAHKYCPDIFTVTTAMKNIYNAIPSWVSSTGTTYVDGMALNGGTYYRTNATTTTIANISSQLSASTTPQNPVYIIIKTGQRIVLSNALDAPVGGVPKDPRVFFILEGTGSLILQHQTSAVVYGTSSTNLYVNSPSGGTSTLYGQVRVGRMQHINSNNIASLNNNQIILDYQTASTPSTVTWTAGEYKKATY